MRLSIDILAVPAALAVATAAHADVKISTAPTQNMSCSSGICSPTAKNAVLNVIDLENLLASGNVTVTTTGSGVQTNNIEIDGTLTWSGAATLVLDAQQSVFVDGQVSVTGLGGLSITTNDGGRKGYFGFGIRGHVVFTNLSSTLTINDVSYTLETDIKSLAAVIAANPAGNFALANAYDASIDGSYTNSAIPTRFAGAFEGLGNAISHLSIEGSGNANDPVGLFAELVSGNESGGSIENIVLRGVKVGGSGLIVGGLVGVNDGIISNASISGSLTATFQHGTPTIGGLVGYSPTGAVIRSVAITTISGDEAGSEGGGLVGFSGGAISDSYADCVISAGESSYFGGLVGGNTGSITESYALGSIGPGGNSEVGGLVSDNADGSTISQSYSTTAIKKGGNPNLVAGGLIGVDRSSAGNNRSDYWDTSTSHIKNHKRGAGTPNRDPGITGLTTEQLQSRLPNGFDPKVWAENPKINNGFPYLINNPPRKD